MKKMVKEIIGIKFDSLIRIGRGRIKAISTSKIKKITAIK
jgi:hypothetical protein